jgi:hydroxyacylglutathione hydrolase
LAQSEQSREAVAMYFTQLQNPEAGCLSYVLGCLGTRELAVVDPGREVESYLRIAEEQASRITHVIDTHIHADHLSGGPELARRAAAPYCLHERAAVSVEFRPLADGEVLEVGNARIEVIHTPGHSPESVCLLVADRARSEEAAFLLTGDTLLIGDVGRPDLHVEAETGARDLHASLHGRVLGLGDHLELFPAHYGRSPCGAGLSPRPSSTLGYERRVNPLLGDAGVDDFVRLLLERTPKRPDRYLEIVAANRGGA